jgi:hypothetical protein
MDEETWTRRHGRGDMDEETWTWRHGHGDKVMNHDHGDKVMIMETRTDMGMRRIASLLFIQRKCFV